MVKLNGCICQSMTYWKNIILFRIKSTLILKKNLIANLSYGYEMTIFHNEEIPKEDSNHTCLVIISLDFALKKMETIIDKCF